MAMFDEATASMGGVSTEPIGKPKTRAQKVEEWRVTHRKEYEKACADANCTCTPSRAQALIMEQYSNPPID